MRSLLVIFAFLTGLLSGQTKVEIEILNRVIENSFSPVQDFFMKDSISDVKLKFLSDDEKIIPLIRSKILSGFKENSSSKNVLEVIVNRYEVKYPAIVSYPLFGEEKLKREIELNLTYNLFENDITKFHHNFGYVHTDTIPVSSIVLDEKDSTVYNSIPSIPIWRSLVEPAIISSVTGLIVYLFFTVRSR